MLLSCSALHACIGAASSWGTPEVVDSLNRCICSSLGMCFVHAGLCLQLVCAELPLPGLALELHKLPPEVLLSLGGLGEFPFKPRLGQNGPTLRHLAGEKEGQGHTALHHWARGIAQVGAWGGRAR